MCVCVCVLTGIIISMLLVQLYVLSDNMYDKNVEFVACMNLPY